MNTLLNKEKRYWAWLAMWCQYLVGTFLLFEHSYIWGGTDPTFGHEWLGLFIIATGAVTGLLCRKETKVFYIKAVSNI